MAKPKSVYQQVVAITAEYLGPSAERFISRQITMHLQKSPEKLNKSDIPQLIEWVRITFSMLTNDQKLIDSFTNELRALAKTSNNTRVPDAQSK